jgi:hypothetical protein
MNSDARQLSDRELNNYLEVYEKRERHLTRTGAEDKTRTYELEMVRRDLARLRAEKERRK